MCFLLEIMVMEMFGLYFYLFELLYMYLFVFKRFIAFFGCIPKLFSRYYQSATKI